MPRTPPNTAMTSSTSSRPAGRLLDAMLMVTRPSYGHVPRPYVGRGHPTGLPLRGVHGSDTGTLRPQERGPVSVEVAEGVLGIQGTVPQLPRGLVLQGAHQPQPHRLAGGGAGRGAQGAGAPGLAPEVPARLGQHVQGLGGACVAGAHALFGGRVRGRRVHG